MNFDCFGFRRGDNKVWCSALKKLDCDECSFYKTKAQVAEEERLVNKRVLFLKDSKINILG